MSLALKHLPDAETHRGSPGIVRVSQSSLCCDEVWEQAYLRFETIEDETRKFLRRLRRLGAPNWPHEARIAELFCGRGSGLDALRRLGFDALEGVDLSERLLVNCTVPARLYVCDCRRLPFDSNSRDILIVQGGLHHLPLLPDDLCAVLDEAWRVLTPGGRLVVVEPWRTPFLRLALAVSRSRLVRRSVRRVDCFATMVERELDTYQTWLNHPNVILRELECRFQAEILRIGWGKLMFLGRKSA